MSKKRVLAIALSAGLSLLSPGCIPKEAKPTPGGEVRLAWTGGLVGLDPFTNWGADAQQILHLIFSPLYLSKGDPLNIAAQAIPDEDNKVWRFLLKRNCYFHDDPCFPNGRGRRVTAYDVQFTYERAESLWDSEHLEPLINIREIVADDSLTVRFTLRRPDPHFSDRLSCEFLLIVPPEAVEKYQDDFYLHPVGSGPFRMESWDEQELILVKNSRFWAKDRWGQGLPYLDRIIIRFSKDPNAAFNALLQGDLDVAEVTQDCWPLVFNRDGGGLRLSKELEGRFHLAYGKGPNLTVLYLGLEQPLFKNPLFRQALNYGIDRRAFQNLLPKLRYQAAYGPTSQPLGNAYFKYNPEKAKKLLARAGYHRGVGLPAFTFLYNPQVFSREIALRLQPQLERLGLKTSLICATRPKANSGEVNSDLGIITITYPDSNPATQLGAYVSTGYPGVDFSSAGFDSLWRAYENNPVRDSSRFLLATMESLVVQDPPFVYLYWSYPVWLVRRDIRDLDPVYILSPFTYVKR